VVRALFPHEREAVILDASGPLTSVMLVRKGLFTALAEVSPGARGQSWIQTVIDEFAKLAEQYPLPRTIFLLAREPGITSLHQALDAANLEKLWLADNPPKIVPVLASHIAGTIRQVTTAPPDLQLLLMALYYQQCRAVKEK